jgi:hypothetical protein
MPYADPDQRKARQRDSQKRRYAVSGSFRKKEAARKAEWYQRPEVKAHRAEMLRQWRAKKKRRVIKTTSRKEPDPSPLEILANLVFIGLSCQRLALILLRFLLLFPTE